MGSNFAARLAALEALEAVYAQQDDADDPRVVEYWRRWVAEHTWTPADHATRIDVLLDDYRGYQDVFYWNKAYYGPDARPRPSGPGATNAQSILRALHSSCHEPRKADAALAGIRRLLDKLRAADDPRAGEFAAFVAWSAEIVTNRLELYMGDGHHRYTPGGRRPN